MHQLSLDMAVGLGYHGNIPTREEVKKMYGNRRTRLDLEADWHEIFRYFGLLRGVTAGMVMRQALARYAVDVEKEFPPVRAHMLAWREAMAAQRANPVVAIREHEFNATHHVSLDDLPF